MSAIVTFWVTYGSASARRSAVRDPRTDGGIAGTGLVTQIDLGLFSEHPHGAQRVGDDVTDIDDVSPLRIADSCALISSSSMISLNI